MSTRLDIISAQEAPNMHEEKVAIIVHAFHLDALDEILSHVSALPSHHKLFVTTTEDREAAVRSRLELSGRDYALQIVNNRGRDVLPFLLILPALKSESFDLFIKVHTKKSMHRKDGDAWRLALMEQLLLPDVVTRLVQAFADDPRLGIVGPEKHYVSFARFLGANSRAVLAIVSRLGLSKEQAMASGFFAGTMFMARVGAMQPLLDLGYADKDFEAENGQVDGTFAHALERCMALGAAVLGYRIAPTNNPDAVALPNRRHAFASARAEPPRGILGALVFRVREAGRKFERVIRTSLRQARKRDF